MRAIAVVLAVVLLSAGPHAQAQATGTVRIRDNAYEPADVHVGRGGRVTWALMEGTHTVTADTPKGFDSGTMAGAGSSYSVDVPNDDVTIYYHCRIHGTPGDGTRFGSGMVGRIVVGAGSPAPRHPSDTEVRTVPSARWPNLDRALRGLRPDGRYRIELGRGTYRAIDLTPSNLGLTGQPGPAFSLDLRGSGPSTVFRGSGVAIGIGVDGVRIARMAFAGQTFAAVHVAGAERWGVDDVTITSPRRYGISIDDAPRGSIRGSRITRAGVAGIGVRRCPECDLVVDRVGVSSSRQGMVAYGAGALVVIGSRFERNGVGVALKASLDDPSPHRGAHIFGNVFANNTSREHPTPPLGTDRDLAVGAGVWIDGGAFDVIERNRFDGHSFGVVLTTANLSSRVSRNVFASSAEADIAWDGLGLGVCFAANRSSRGATATSMPPLAQELYRCDVPMTVGLPYPAVPARLALWGARS